jgi:PAS domain S-box-containing protein
MIWIPAGSLSGKQLSRDILDEAVIEVKKRDLAKPEAKSQVQEMGQRKTRKKTMKTRAAQVDCAGRGINERYEALFNRTLFCVYVHDFEGRFLDANEAALNLLGYEESEIRNINFSSLLDEGQMNAAFKTIAEIKRTGFQKQPTIYKLRKKDGGHIWVETEASVIYKSGKPFAVQGIARDISDRMRIEESLRESEEMFRGISASAQDAIIVIDNDGNISYWNDAAERIFGYAKKEAVGQPASIIIPDEYSDAFTKGFAVFRETGKGPQVDETLELTARRKDRSRFPVELSVGGAKIKNKWNAIGIVRDITERKLAMEALWESEEKFRNLAEQSPNMIFINRKRRIVYANEKCEEIMGYTRQELYSPDFDFLVLIAPEFREKVKGNFNRHLRGEDVPPYEYTILTKAGKRIEAILTPKLIDYEKEKAILGTITDITQQKKAEKIKGSIYKISEAVHSARGLEELFRSIHTIIGELMPAKNFYIALYDKDKERLSFPYFADEYDQTPAPKKLGKGLTEYVLRTGEALLASPEVFEELVRKGEAELIGAPSIDWLGAPLKMDHQTFGVLVVQSYTEGIRFGEEAKEILNFVSGQTAMAIRRKHQEEKIRESLREKEVLLQEVHHRVKNNMQIISSLLNLQASQTKDRDFIRMVKDSQSRIRSIALVHEKLYRSRDFANINFSDYAESLTVHLFQFNQVDSSVVRLRTKLEDVFLDIQTAIPCGLILNELVTNALKHAFPAGTDGEILVELRPLEEDAFEMIVRDNGVGIPDGLDVGSTATLGLQIVTTLVRQIEGSMEVQGDGGTAVKVVFKRSRYKPGL